MRLYYIAAGTPQELIINLGFQNEICKLKLVHCFSVDGVSILIMNDLQ